MAALDAVVSSSSSSSWYMAASSASFTAEATLGGDGVAAGSARAAPSPFSRQERLSFLPLPQGQGSFRPALAISAILAGRRHPLYQALLADVRFHELLLAFDPDLASAACARGCGLCGDRKSTR